MHDWNLMTPEFQSLIKKDLVQIQSGKDVKKNYKDQCQFES